MGIMILGEMVWYRLCGVVFLSGRDQAGLYKPPRPVVWGYHETRGMGSGRGGEPRGPGAEGERATEAAAVIVLSFAIYCLIFVV